MCERVEWQQEFFHQNTDEKTWSGCADESERDTPDENIARIVLNVNHGPTQRVLDTLHRHAETALLDILDAFWCVTIFCFFFCFSFSLSCLVLSVVIDVSQRASVPERIRPITANVGTCWERWRRQHETEIKIMHKMCSVNVSELHGFDFIGCEHTQTHTHSERLSSTCVRMAVWLTDWLTVSVFATFVACSKRKRERETIMLSFVLRKRLPIPLIHIEPN